MGRKPCAVRRSEGSSETETLFVVMRLFAQRVIRLLRRSKRELLYRRKVAFRRASLVSKALFGVKPCQLCGNRTRLRLAYRRPFHHCPTCNFIFTEDFTNSEVSKGMGMEGSWSGPGGGGFRELWLAQWLETDFGKKSFLLFGTGNTLTFETLRKRGWDIVGCDIAEDLVQYQTKCFRSGHILPHRSLARSQVRRRNRSGGV